MPDSNASAEPDSKNLHLQRVPFVAVTIAFIAGILTSNFLSLSLLIPLVLLFLMVTACVTFLCFRKKTAATVALFACFWAAGAADFSYQCNYKPATHVANIVSSERLFARVRGIICTPPFSRRKAPLLLSYSGYDDWGWETAFDLELSGIEKGGQVLPLSGRITVKLYEQNPGLKFGDEITMVGQLQAPNIPQNPAQFNYREYLRRKGIHAIMYVSNDGGIEWTGRTSNSFRRLLFNARDRLVEFITATEQPGSDLLAAMLLGARERLAPDDEENFQKSGITHVLAISGLHVGMVAALLYFVTALIRMPEKVKVPIILTGLAVYVLLTGARPPAVRAAVLCAVLLFGGLLDRRQISVNSLALAALLILFVAPGEVFMRGFQLSFIAVLSIICFYKPIRNAIGRLRHPLEALQDPEEMAWWLRIWIAVRENLGPVVAVSLAASIGVTPIVAATFHIFSIFGIVANALFVPLASVAVWLGMFGLCAALPLSLVWSQADVLLIPADLVASAVKKLACLGANFPLSHFYTAGPSLQLLAVYYAVLLLIVWRRHLHLTFKRLSFGVLVFLSIFAAGALWPAASQELTVTCLDVRHGGCTFLEFPSGKTMLYDCGTASHFFDVGSYTLAPLLWEKGINSIDLVVLSHPDADHVNGVISLTNYFRIGCVAHSTHFTEEPLGRRLLAELEKRGVEHRAFTAGDRLLLGQAEVNVVYPPRQLPFTVGTAVNNDSLVVQVAASGKKILLTGDIEEEATALLLLSEKDLQSDVMLLPHHGSTYANLDNLLKAASPRVAIASCAADEVTLELRKTMGASGASLYTTAECGAIEIRTANNELSIVSYTGGE